MQPVNWETVYRHHSRGVYQYLLTLARQSQEAEDLLQETFVRAMRSVSTLQRPEKIRSWLLTIARNLFLDSKRKPQLTLTQLDTVTESPPAALEPLDHPEQEVLQADFMRQFQAAVAALPEHYQTAVTLGIMQRLPYVEIADITGWSLATVKINIFRARKMMAEALRNHLR